MRWLSIGLYNLCLPLLLVIMLPMALIKMKRRGGRLRDFAQRIGLLSAAQRSWLLQAPEPCYWVHAVSVGEIGVAKKWITELLSQQPSLRVVLTTSTATGYALACEYAAQQTRVLAVYSPLDVPGVSQRFLNLIRPQKLVLVEAEVWPNLMRAASGRRIPCYLINARLSVSSERRYAKVAALVRPVFQQLAQVQVQQASDQTASSLRAALNMIPRVLQLQEIRSAAYAPSCSSMG
jgi:3-deoxy-D-manno-octulosonic-acid transferase